MSAEALSEPLTASVLRAAARATPLDAPRPRSTTTPPTPGEVAAAVAGLAAAGAATALGLVAASGVALSWQAIAVGATTWPAAWLRAAAIVGPSLPVAAAVFGVPLTAADAAGALAAGVVRSGRIAAGVTPVTLFFALTSSVAPLIGVLGAVWAGLEGLAAVGAHLDQDAADAWLLVSAWRAVLVLVAARLLFTSLAELGSAAAW